MNATIKNVRIAELAYNVTNNYSRHGNYEESSTVKNELISSLANGWNSSLGGVIHVSTTPESELKAEMEARSNVYNRIMSGDNSDFTDYEVGVQGFDDLGEASSKTVKLTAQMQAEAWLSLYTDSKGKLIEPKYVGNTGYRRYSFYVKANALAVAENREGILKVPVDVKVYENELSRILDNLGENGGKDVGCLKPTRLDVFLEVQRACELGATEKQLVDSGTCKRAIAQKYRSLFLIGRKHDINIVDMVQGEKPEIALSKITATSAIRIKNDLDLVEGAKKSYTYSREEVVQWLKSSTEELEPAKTMLSSSQVKSAINDSTLSIQKYCFEAVSEGDEAKAMVIPYFTQYKALEKAIARAEKAGKDLKDIVTLLDGYLTK